MFVNIDDVIEFRCARDIKQSIIGTNGKVVMKYVVIEWTAFCTHPEVSIHTANHVTLG